MKVIFDIKTCDDCPKYDCYEGYCKVTKRELTATELLSDNMPKWCPLEEV